MVMLKKDRLPVGFFRNPDGKNFRIAEEVDLESFGKFLQDTGFEVGCLTQPWRHAIGLVRKHGEELFVKLASTPGISEKTRNEVSWNQQMKKELRRAGYTGMVVPEIAETGIFDGKFYYLSSF